MKNILQSKQYKEWGADENVATTWIKEDRKAGSLGLPAPIHQGSAFF